MLAGQKPASKRIIRNHANTLFTTQGKEFVLDFTEQHIIARLNTVEARQTELVALPQGQGQTPGLKIRAANVAHLALMNQVVQGLQGLLNRRFRVGRVDLIQVDIIRLQARETRLNRGADMLAREAPVVRSVTHRPPAFGGQDDVLAPAFEPFADNLLGTARGFDATAGRIHIRAIKEIHPVLECGIHNGEALGFFALTPEGHGPQADFRNIQTGSPHSRCFHLSSF